MTAHALPRVVEFSHEYDVRVETHHNLTRIVARIKPGKTPRLYRKLHDLPFTAPGDGRWHFWAVTPATSHAEASERGRYFWNEFVAFARGPQKRRATDAAFAVRTILCAMFVREFPADTEAWVFLERLAEALVAHLRVGLDGEGE